MNKKVSVIIACLNEEKYLRNAMDTLLNMDYPQELLEILIVDGGSSDKTLDIVNKYLDNNQNIKLLYNPKRISPVAFNIGINAATSDYILLMSAHSQYPPDYISILTEKIEELNADLIGGIAETHTLTKSKKTNSIIKVLTNKFGLGGAKVRVGVNKPQLVDTVTGMFRKTIFDKTGLFDEKLVRNQDMELSKRITTVGGKIFLIPDVKFIYFARENFKDLWENNFNNGLWVPKTVYITKNVGSLCLRHFIPLAFILSLILPAILSFFWFPAIFLSIFSFITHLIFVIFISLKINNRETGLFYLIKCFYTLHFSYGTGSLSGIFCIHDLINKK